MKNYKYILGIDGGGSNTRGVIFNQKGQILTELKAKGSNLYVYKENGVKIIIDLVKKLAKKANLDAIVCSAQEVKIVKKIFKKEIITPGIRLNNKNNDQKRVQTPKQAFINGAHSLVIGRNITKGDIKKNIQTLIDHLSQ